MADAAEPDGERRWRLFLWLCAALRGDPVEWPADPADTEWLIAMAGNEWITPTLAIALKEAVALPDPVRDYLDAVALLNRERNEQIVQAVECAAACLAAAGIRAVFLKGAAHLANDLYPDLASRFLGDVDVLVPRAAAADAIRKLADGGFSDIEPPKRRWIKLRSHDSPLQRHAENGVGIEVHRELLNLAHPGLVSSDLVFETAVPAKLGGGVLVPNLRIRALHAILHDQLNHGWRRRHCSLRMLCDVAQLFAQPNADEQLADLASDLSGSKRRMVNHSVALAGLLGVAGDAQATERACMRQRRGIERPTYVLPDRLVDDLSRLRFQPLAAVNLLDPLRLPERLARFRAQVTKPR